MLLAGAVQLLFPQNAAAKYIGADPARRGGPCSCSCSCAATPGLEPSNTSSAISRTEGNLMEQVDLSRITGGSGASILFTAVYNSYNADGSRAQVDTVMGFGWTHSYNIFLFNQLGAMFRFDGDGRVTRYGLGLGGTFIAQPGDFETLVRNPDGTFTLTQTDQTVFTFASIPGTPFLVGGPVYMLTSIVDRNGNRTTLTYTSGLLTSITNAYGRSMTLAYNAQNHLTSLTDPAGRVTQFQYDSTGHRLASISDATGRSVQYSYNVLFQLTSKTDRAARTFSYVYTNSEPAAVKDSLGTAKSTLSNPNNWATNSTTLALSQMRAYLPSTTSIMDGRGNVSQYQYNTNGYVTLITAADGTTSSYTYDAATLMPSSMTDPNGNTTAYQYDSQGNLIKITDAFSHVTTYTYEPVFNMMTSMTDPRGRTTTYAYDAKGNRVQETDPLVQSRSWTYDNHGNVVTATDKNGHTTRYQYDAFGNQTQVADPLGNATNMTYDAVGNLLSSTNPNNHTTNYQYDGLNRIIKTTDATGHFSQTFYDGEGNRTEVIDRNSHTTSYQYDQRQRLTGTTDALGKVESYAYDLADNRVSFTDRNTFTTVYAYDVQNRLIQITDALGNTNKTTYDAASNVLTKTDANGKTTTYGYDALNRHSMMTDALNEQTQYQYDTGTLPSCPTCGATPGSRLVTGQTDPNGKVTYYKYDALDRLIDTVQKVGSTSDTITPSDAVTSYTYDAVGNRLTLTEPNGNTTTDQYDFDNRRTRETNAAGDVSIINYDPAGNVSTVTAPNLNVTANAYDTLERVIQVTDSAGLVATYTYDPEGNVLTQGDGNGNITAFGYDALNRLVTVTDPLGKSTTSQYDNVGNLTQSTDRNGNATAYTYDAVNRRITMTDALGDTTKYQYDPVGNLKGLTDANSHTTQYFYDPVNRPSQETYADGRLRQFTYDRAGNLITRTDQLGQVTNYTYSDLYFLVSRTYPSSINDTFTYDLSGRVLTAQRGAWPDTFTYDGANRVIQTGQNGRTITYVYNIPGRTRTVTYPGGRVTTEHTDARMRLDHIDDAGSPPPIVQYTYDPGNRAVSRTYRNGTTTMFSYNGNDWILNLQHSHGATPIAGFNYTYDNEGNKQFENKLQDTGHSEAYQYDTTYRLINYAVGTLIGSTVPVPITQTSYSLDPVGNWNSKTTNGVMQNRVHDAVNELIKIDATNLTYDPTGNLQNDGVYTYTYDEEFRLTKVTRIADSAVVGQYQYDALSRRVQKIANPAGTPSTTLYFYDDMRTIEEQNGGGATQATYVYGDYVDEVLTMDRGGQTFYYHQNALWSVEAITDSLANPVERYSYDAYGSVTVTDGAFNPIAPNAWGTPHSAIGNPWTFTGRQFEEETGLYFYRARTYDPAKGRFLQRDALEYVDAMNLYQYALGNPTTFVDPTGRQPGPYANTSQEELIKLWEQLVYSRPSLEILSRMDPNSDWAKRYNYTAARIKDAQERLKNMDQKLAELRKELDRRQAQACPAAAAPAKNPCEVFWLIMNIAGEYDVVNSAVQAIEIVGTIGTFGGWLAAKPAAEGGKKLTKEAIVKWIQDTLKKTIKDLPEIANLKGGRALLNNILDPEKACAALAECEWNVNKRGGFYQRLNYFNRVIRGCSWNNGTANWYKSGLQIGRWDRAWFVGGLFGASVTWQIEK